MMNTNFLEKVKSTIEKNKLFSIENDQILVGVSGGIDSMVLLDSLNQLHCKIAVAHCNFKLRGVDSDGDQTFVERYATSHKIPIHICSFETSEVARQQKISIEMAARNLRYDWFETLCKLHGYSHIAIAHNQNDTIETFFINLLRSAGLRGLQGIPIKNGKIVRPLLDTTRNEIEEYSTSHSILYRTDFTNYSNDYVRNKIRNIVIPEIKKVSPSCIDAISTSITYLQSAYSLYQDQIEKIKKDCCRETEKGLEVDEQKVLAQNESKTILFEILHPFGFNTDIISQIYEVLTQQSGKTFDSGQYKAIHDRNMLFIVRKTIEDVEPVSITVPEGTYSLLGTTIHVSLVDRKSVEIIRDKSIAMLDFDEISFPITLRVWQQGDSFAPFGMKGRKKISDFLINEKVPLVEKDSISVLEVGGKIAWVVGMRISQDFAITEKTEKVLMIKAE